jgi:hypothetical protein
MVYVLHLFYIRQKYCFARFLLQINFILLLLNVISHGDILLLISIALATISPIYTSLFLFQRTYLQISGSKPDRICFGLVSYFSDSVSSHSLCWFLVQVGKQHMRCGFAYRVYVLFLINSDPALFMHHIYTWTHSITTPTIQYLWSALYKKHHKFEIIKNWVWYFELSLSATVQI